MEGMFGFGCAINARRRSFISKNWNFQMHFDTDARSFQRRKCASSLTLCLWDFPKYLFFWGKKKTCETEFYTSFPLVTCALPLKDINRRDKYRKCIFILKTGRSFCFYQKVSNIWKNAQTADTQIARKMSPFFKSIIV